MPLADCDPRRLSTKVKIRDAIDSFDPNLAECVTVISPKPAHRSWLVLSAAIGGALLVVTALAIALLLRVPALPNCPAIFWPLASASMRLYCAEVAANKRTVRDLLEAIALVEVLPADHELRPQANRYLVAWVEEILRLADGAVQAGNLEEALKIARQIPTTVPNHGQVKAQMADWERDWREAEGIYNAVIGAIDQRKWDAAIGNANRLVRGPLRYWATVKHDELRVLIAETRQDDGRIRRALALAKGGNPDRFEQAFELLRGIEARRRLYPLAQQTIADLTEQVLTLAQESIDRGNGEAALRWADLLPDRESLRAQAEDLRNLATAETAAKGGTPKDLEVAIEEASKIPEGRPLYERAQAKIAQWRRDSEDAARLERAKELAQSGTLVDLTNAISQAQEIPDTSGLAALARREITNWSRQIQELRDRPLLDQAETLAGQGRWAEAIAQAQRIEPESPLAADARRRVAAWRAELEQRQDEPILQQAEELARGGDLAGAIDMANQIASGRSLYRQAQQAIARWQTQRQDQQQLTEAQQLATANSPDGLVSAILLADRVKRNSPWRSQADGNIARWSQQLLALAQQQAANGDLPGAVALARRIPRAATTYEAAQTQISAWQRWISPAPASP